MTIEKEVNVYKKTKEDYFRTIIKRYIAKAVKKSNKRCTFVFHFLVERAMHKQLMKLYDLTSRYKDTSLLKDFGIEDQYGKFQIINFKVNDWKQRSIQDHCSPLGMGIKFEIFTNIDMDDENIEVIRNYVLE